LDAIVLDEADVLLPPPPKVRGSGPAGNRIKSGRGSSSESGGGAKKKSKEPDLPTVKLLRYMALHNDKDDFQVCVCMCNFACTFIVYVNHALDIAYTCYEFSGLSKE
jgi:hypothetical protein